MGVTRRSLLMAPFLRLPARAANRRPNVVAFMTDDHGAWAMGAYGCRDMRTPNLDHLAAEGARFTRAYACSPIDSPSRMSYITGLIPSQHGVQDDLLDEDSYGPKSRRFLDGHLTYSEILAKNGYTLGMSGKWHMGDDTHAQRGFSYWHAMPGAGGTYRDPEFYTNGARRKLFGFKTDLVADGALEFLDRSKDKNFYLLVNFNAPHEPYDFQPDRDRELYKGCEFGCFPDEDANPNQNPAFARLANKKEPKLAYSALVSGVDRNVGRILHRLDRLKLREDTLVVFTANQGWNAGHHGIWGRGNGTLPFNLYEESIRVPMIWNHPGHIRSGHVVTPMVASYDFFPTILDYLGLPPHRDPKLAGRSYADFLRGRPANWNNRLFFEYSYMRGVRTESLKYVERTKDLPSELYDLEADPGESENVIRDAGYAKALGGLRAEMTKFFQDRGAPALADWRNTTKQNLPEYKRKAAK
jgi:arylsulfatase A-like enzyme